MLRKQPSLSGEQKKPARQKQQRHGLPGPSGGLVRKERFELSRLAAPAPQAGASASAAPAACFQLARVTLLACKRPLTSCPASSSPVAASSAPVPAGSLSGPSSAEPVRPELRPAPVG